MWSLKHSDNLRKDISTRWTVVCSPIRRKSPSTPSTKPWWLQEEFTLITLTDIVS